MILINQRREKRFIRFSWKPKSLCNNKPKRVKEKERETERESEHESLSNCLFKIYIT